MRTLHLIRKSRDPLAEEAISYEAREGSVSVLLIQDGVLNRSPFPGEVFVSLEDLEARAQESPHRKIDYTEIGRIILRHERTVVW
jgi:sulfur transfer complex TusBCD TusB component (DsrH family)